MTKKPESVSALDELGRVRLSKSLFMREFLYREVLSNDSLLEAVSFYLVQAPKQEAAEDRAERARVLEVAGVGNGYGALTVTDGEHRQAAQERHGLSGRQQHGETGRGEGAHQDRAARHGVRVEVLLGVVDLGAQVGTRTWWRGARTCVLLCGTTFLMAPSVEAIPTISQPLEQAQWDEARAQAITHCWSAGRTRSPSGRSR